MFQSQKIAELQARIETLEGEIADEKAAKVAAETSLTQAKADLETAQAEAEKVPGLQEQLTTEKARADKAETDLAAEKATFDAKVEAEVVNRLAAAGTEGIKRDPAVGKEDHSSTAGLTGIAKAGAALAARQKKQTK